MTAPYGAPVEAPLAPVAPPRRRPDPADVRVALAAAVTLTLLGALLGLLWSAWSPPGPSAEVLGGGSFAVLDESESAVAGDGRFLVITAATGLLAALLTWFWRRGNRGAAMLFGLSAGAAVGALLTELVGHLSGGGSVSGKVYELTDGSHAEITRHLPLSLHLQGLLVVEPAVVALVYGVLVAFAERDDLGRPDPVRDGVRQERSVLPPYPPAGPPPGYPPAWPGSVDAGDHAQYGGGDGDAPGAAQQRDLPPQ